MKVLNSFDSRFKGERFEQLNTPIFLRLKRVSTRPGGMPRSKSKLPRSSSTYQENINDETSFWPNIFQYIGSQFLYIPTKVHSHQMNTIHLVRVVPRHMIAILSPHACKALPPFPPCLLIEKHIRRTLGGSRDSEPETLQLLVRRWSSSPCGVCRSIYKSTDQICALTGFRDGIILR